ncbi:MAG: SufS family cysteine desulfurase [Thaumarchaeota archaeon]|jgi:cysteine desulfurase/selenocysteine lyase|nr:SufS family cysteine desulfurase [Candidatus Geocrenenecus arthurdayi]MCL7390991.1 SufS family cysteine desulfurase [Candidatus Geocrenenecus arthurdayi]MCL7396178.1 SufS family cysteine desulfurase [Candidatus Geocrenenecus arthurdayi]MCL7403215.1 SufS family cysteine desulfurase [Candidatus Geocrenenecus arthurdayi]
MSCTNLEETRRDFPILERKIRGKRLVYLDSAASSLKPIQVVEAIRDFYLSEYSNIHRGIHYLSQLATSRYEEAREKIARFINANSPEEVIFTYGTTDSLNMLAYSYGLKVLKPGDEILLTVMEHHSNILPWMRISSITGAKIRYLDITDEGLIDYERLDEKINDKTKIVSIAHMSNVLGTIVDLRRIAKKIHEVGGVIVVDGAQSVPHMPINVRELEIDFLAFSGHKMLGPTGIGVLWVKHDLLDDLPPFRLGGGAIREVTLNDFMLLDPPHSFEAGTPNIAGVIGLAAAVEYLQKIGMGNVRMHEEELTGYALRNLDNLGDSITVYGPKNVSVRGGIITFNIRGLESNIVGSLLDSYGIAVRTGKHCAHPLHQRLKIDGTVRASIYLYNVREEIDYLISTLEEITAEVR